VEVALANGTLTSVTPASHPHLWRALQAREQAPAGLACQRSPTKGVARGSLHVCECGCHRGGSDEGFGCAPARRPLPSDLTVTLIQLLLHMPALHADVGYKLQLMGQLGASGDMRMCNSAVDALNDHQETAKT